MQFAHLTQPVSGGTALSNGGLDFLHEVLNDQIKTKAELSSLIPEYIDAFTASSSHAQEKVVSRELVPTENSKSQPKSKSMLQSANKVVSLLRMAKAGSPPLSVSNDLAETEHSPMSTAPLHNRIKQLQLRTRRRGSLRLRPGETPRPSPLNINF